MSCQIKALEFYVSDKSWNFKEFEAWTLIQPWGQWGHADSDTHRQKLVKQMLNYFLSLVIIYSFNLPTQINIDGSLWQRWQSYILPGILRAASRSLPSAATSGPPLSVQVIMQQEWRRTVAWHNIFTLSNLSFNLFVLLNFLSIPAPWCSNKCL